MRVILNIKKKKASALLEVLKDLSYVKITKLSKEKGKQMEDLTEAVIQLNLIKAGKLTGIDARELFDKL